MLVSEAQLYVDRAQLNGNDTALLDSAELKLKNALGIDETNVSAYIGLKRVYETKHDYFKCIDILNELLDFGNLDNKEVIYLNFELFRNYYFVDDIVNQKY